VAALIRSRGARGSSLLSTSNFSRMFRPWHSLVRRLATQPDRDLKWDGEPAFTCSN
jgi:hypothetical protein